MIYRATLEDSNEVYQLICTLEQEVFHKDTFLKIYQENSVNHYYYVYKIDQKCVGFISLYIKQTLHHNGKTGEIIELVVDEKYRSQHIGEQLLQHIEHLANELGLLEIELSTNMKRIRAHSFYENHGYIKNHYNLVKKM